MILDCHAASSLQARHPQGLAVSHEQIRVSTQALKGLFTNLRQKVLNFVIFDREVLEGLKLNDTRG